MFVFESPSIYHSAINSKALIKHSLYYFEKYKIQVIFKGGGALGMEGLQHTFENGSLPIQVL